MQPISNTAMEQFADRSLAELLTVVPDGLACFAKTHANVGLHDCQVTGGGKAAVSPPKFQAVSTTLGNLKTPMTGAYHAIVFRKYGYRHLAGFQYRFNLRFHLLALLRRLGACRT